LDIHDEYKIKGVGTDLNQKELCSLKQSSFTRTLYENEKNYLLFNAIPLSVSHC